MYLMIMTIKELSTASLTPTITEDKLLNDSTPSNFSYSHYTLYFKYCLKFYYLLYIKNEGPNEIAQKVNSSAVQA